MCGMPLGGRSTATVTTTGPRHGSPSSSRTSSRVPRGRSEAAGVDPVVERHHPVGAQPGMRDVVAAGMLGDGDHPVGAPTERPRRRAGCGPRPGAAARRFQGVEGGHDRDARGGGRPGAEDVGELELGVDDVGAGRRRRSAPAGSASGCRSRRIPRSRPGCPSAAMSAATGLPSRSCRAHDRGHDGAPGGRLR